jgi:hypothetical protein
MNVSDIKSAASFVLVRLGWGALVSSVAILGGVYFIVDNALRGLENSVDGVRSQIVQQSASLNTRIDDLSRSLNEKIDLKFELLSQKLESEFSDTRKEIKKADLPLNDLLRDLAIPFPELKLTEVGSFEMLLNPSAPTLDSISMADPTFANWAKILSNSEELKKLQASGIVVHATATKTGPEVTWVAASDGAQIALDAISKMKDCLGVYNLTTGKAVVGPVGTAATVGKDGIFCKSEQ